MVDSHDTGPLSSLDGISSWVERPVRRVAGDRLNPLPHAGTISVFLLGVVIVTGLYITLFFEFGHEASYRSVAAMEDHAIQRPMRALHRYSSAALVLTTVIHGWRIFVAGRIAGRQRRWRWATGVAALVFVWLAGVTGYWLVGDIRAQALSEVMIGLIGDTGFGASLAIRQFAALGNSSGSGLLLVLWLLHLALTLVIAWFAFRHLRRSKLPWLPPRHWMLLMGGALLVVSVVAPLGILEQADPERLSVDMPLDAFVLFLLPPLLSNAAPLFAVLGLVVVAVLFVLPRLVKRTNPEAISIDPVACTGCELCVIDCPYDALRMDDALAVVDPAVCVACGICVGSCAFGAIDLAGWSALPNPSADQPEPLKDKTVVVACDRHAAEGDLESDERVVVAVRCAGMLAPNALREFKEGGAKDVHVIGCAPGDCRFGVGNQLAADRLSGVRSPHPSRRWVADLTQDWVPINEAAQALNTPGQHRSADVTKAPDKRESCVGAAGVVALSVAAIAMATSAPFSGAGDQAEIRLVVDHSVGNSIAAIEEQGPIGRLSAVELTVGETVVGDSELIQEGDTSIGLVDWDADPGSVQVKITGRHNGQTTTLFDQMANLLPGERLVVHLPDVPPDPQVEDGKRVFEARASGCAVCHSTEVGVDVVGPSLAGIGTAAETRVDGLIAEQYLRQSILSPDDYVVEGWPSGQMLPIYSDLFTEEELDGLVLYLLSLNEEAE